MPARLASIPPRSALCTVSTRALTFGLSIGRNINAVIIPFLMIVGGARHEPIHRMHGMSLSTHPCQRHSVACGCDVVAVAPRVCVHCLAAISASQAAISASGRERAQPLGLAPRVTSPSCSGGAPEHTVHTSVKASARGYLIFR